MSSKAGGSDGLYRVSGLELGFLAFKLSARDTMSSQPERLMNPYTLTVIRSR